MSSEPQPGRAAQAISLAVTKLTKLGGAAIAVHEAFWGPQQPRPLLVGVAALMIAGAQSAERTLKRLIDKLFEVEP